MENKEINSAVNKVETIAHQTENNETAQNVANEEIIQTENPIKHTKKVKTVKTVTPTTNEKRKQKAEKKAMLIAKKKQASIRKQEQLAAEKLRRKEERIKRRDLIKSETAEARAERIATERSERIRLQKEKAEIKARLLAQKRENKKILKQQRQEQRAADRKDRRSRGVGGWLAAVISLGCATLVLGTLLTFNWIYMSGNNSLLNNAYARAYYDLTGCVDNIDSNLSKLMVSSSPAIQQKLLTDIIVQSELAENELQALPLEDSSKYATSKYINQLGDYSKTLSYKLADGGQLTDEDKQNINELYRRNTNLQQALNKISKEMDKDFTFLSLLNPEDDNTVISNMNELENTSLDYPKMIYDGPFSDGLENRQVKGLKGADVTKEQALKNFKTLFANYAIKQAEVLNECNGDIPTYNIQALTEKDENIYAQMTKQGGKLIMFNCYEPCDKEILTIEECREIAEVFVKKAGFENMTPVWQTASRAVCQFNFASEKDGVIIYSDLVKVNVCMERGLVSAVEATTYFLNHTDRDIPKASISKAQAESTVEGAIVPHSVRLAIVPVGSGETLAYEVFGTGNGSQYYVYVDAKTGKQIEIFKVIESTEGTLLL